jgi:hypothetical protein
MDQQLVDAPSVEVDDLDPPTGHFNMFSKFWQAAHLLYHQPGDGLVVAVTLQRDTDVVGELIRRGSVRRNWLEAGRASG